MQEELRAEIIKFRETLDRLSGKVFYWSYTPVPDFENKELYPLDFQIFMEEIGEMSAGTGIERADGILILELKSPLTYLSALEDDHLSFLIKDYFGHSVEEPYLVDYSGNQVAVPTENVVIIFTPCKYQLNWHWWCSGTERRTR
jgi:hypothetical protein